MYYSLTVCIGCSIMYFYVFAGGGGEAVPVLTLAGSAPTKFKSPALLILVSWLAIGWL